jgi:riboflavin biosynthesis pyrimidine reductase
VLQPFEVLYEAGDLPTYPLPADLEALYGGLGFTTPVLYSNFVSALDGVVTLGSAPSAGSLISGRYPADRFAMGLLRACADAVVIGAGTLRATPGHLWTAGHVFPDLAGSFAELRTGLGRSTDPLLVLVTASGDLDASHPAVVRGALVMTTHDGARAIGGRLPATCEVVELGAGKGLDMVQMVGELHRRGLLVLLTEGGPHLVGQLVEQGLLDELFLTVSPVLAGRGEEKRLGMVEGVELLPQAGVWTELRSLRRHGDYLFTRHRTPGRAARV